MHARQTMLTPEDDIVKNISLPPRGSAMTPSAAIALAINVARQGTGFVSPNPLVGAVVCDKEHRFLQAGAHLRLGQAHAEVNATKGLSAEDLTGATIYVTLEPCAHEGRTPSCAKMLAKLPIQRVVAALQDPNPKTNGQGFAILRAAGIDCAWDSAYAAAASDLAEFFICDQLQHRPFVGLKAALSRDGMIANHGDKRAWISNERSRQFGHYLRLKYDAIAIGQNTLMLDQPALTVRLGSLTSRTPRRVVFDLDLQGAQAVDRATLPLLTQEPEKTIWLVSTTAVNAQRDLVAELRSTGVEVAEFDVAKNSKAMHVPPRQALSYLYDRGIRSLLLEGGAGLYGTFLTDALVDKVHLFQTQAEIPAVQGTHWLSATSIRPRYKEERHTNLAGDVLLEARLKY